MKFENESLPQQGYVVSNLLLSGPDEEGHFTVTAKQEKRGEPDRLITMQYSHNGLAALVGCWRAALGEADDDD